MNRWLVGALAAITSRATADTKIIDGDKAMARLKTASPAGFAVIDGGSAVVKSTFAQSLDCTASDFRIASGVHEAMHAASKRVWPANGEMTQTYAQLGGGGITVPIRPMTGRGVLFSLEPKARHDDYWATYMETMPGSGFAGMLDETNAYAQEQFVEVALVASRPAELVHHSSRDGLLRWIEFDLLYLEALADPATPEHDTSEFPQTPHVTKVETLAMFEPGKPYRLAAIEILGRARKALAATCALPMDRQHEMGIDDAALVARLRTHAATIKTWLPDGDAMIGELDAGFGCAYLALPKPAVKPVKPVKPAAKPR